MLPLLTLVAVKMSGIAVAPAGRVAVRASCCTAWTPGGRPQSRRCTPEQVAVPLEGIGRRTDQPKSRHRWSSGAWP